MSIIGPRPQLVRDMVFMDKEQRKRHSAKYVDMVVNVIKENGYVAG